MPLLNQCLCLQNLVPYFGHHWLHVMVFFSDPIGSRDKTGTNPFPFFNFWVSLSFHCKIISSVSYQYTYLIVTLWAQVMTNKVKFDVQLICSIVFTLFTRHQDQCKTRKKIFLLGLFLHISQLCLASYFKPDLNTTGDIIVHFVHHSLEGHRCTVQKKKSAPYYFYVQSRQMSSCPNCFPNCSHMKALDNFPRDQWFLNLLIKLMVIYLYLEYSLVLLPV